MSDSFKEVADRRTQPGLEPVFIPPHGNFYVPKPVPEPVAQEKTIFGLRKATFWLLLAIGVLVLAMAGMAAGLGIGLSRAHNSDSSPSTLQSSTMAGDAPIAPSSTPTKTLAPSTSTSSTTSSPTSTTGTSTTKATTTTTTSSSTTSSTTGTPTPSSICPDANNTIVTQELGPMSYRIYCDSDFGGSGKETLSSIVLASFDDCLALCTTMNYFQDRTDVGCTYNVEGTGTQTPGTCWCLGGKDKTIVTDVGNVVARPL